MAWGHSIAEEIRNNLDITELVREYVPELTKSGRNFRARCPFHSERTPSFFVNPEIGLYKCFGCGEGGDVIRFLSKIENIAYSEAIKLLAQRVGIELAPQKQELSQESEKRDRLFALIDTAATFYEEALRSSGSKGAPAAYLKERGLTPETVKRFRLGYSPRTGDTALESSLRKGFTIEELTACGLVTLSEKSGNYRDVFSGRIVFPVFDNYGRITGFGGRILPDAGELSAPRAEAPKYLNSADTPLFSKGHLLYGAFQGKTAMRDKKAVIIVEGYMDVLALHQAGLAWTVAPLGTALTPDQAKYIKRFATETVLVMDPDDAGLAAARRAIDVLLSQDIYPKVAVLPGGLDPDEYINEEGREAFSDCVSTARDWLDFCINKQGGAGILEFTQRAQIAEELLTLISRTGNEIYKREWIHRVALGLKLDEQGLLAQTNKLKKRQNKPWASTNIQQVSNVQDTGRVRTIEEEIIQLLKNNSVWPHISLSPEHFMDQRCAMVFKRMQEVMASHGNVPVNVIIEGMNDADIAWLSGLFMEERVLLEDPAARVTQLLENLKSQKLEQRRRILGQEIASMMDGQTPLDQNKVAEYRKLTNKLKAQKGEIILNG